MKKVLIISVSLRKNSNSDLLAQQFAKALRKPDTKWKPFPCGKRTFNSAPAVWPA